MSTRYILIGFGFAFSIGLEFVLYTIKNKIKLIKSLPIHTEETIKKANNTTTTTNAPYTERSSIVTTQFNTTYDEIMLSPYFNNYFYLNSSNVLSNSFLRAYINPRAFSIEKLFPPFIYLLQLICKLNSETHYDKLIDQFNFFIGGDFITLYSSRRIQQINDINHSHLLFQSDILIQGNKADLIYYYKEMYKGFSYIRMISTIPIMIYFSEKLISYLIQKFKFLAFKSKSNEKSAFASYPDKAKCAMCKENSIQIVIKGCNHFQLCEKCFENQGRKCIICNINDSPYIILS